MRGKGQRYLIAFHGFNRTGEDFQVFASTLGTLYTLIAVSLFHHGESKFPERRAGLEKDELRGLIQSLLDKHGISTFSLMGYSLGGKIALVCLELFPERAKDLFLFAPDGIKPAWSYRFASSTWLGQQLFKYTICHPRPLLLLFRMARQCRLINENLYSFLLHHTRSRKDRQFVFDVWQTFRHMQPDLERIKEAINRYNTRVHLFLGKFDSIVPPSTAKRFTRGLKNKNVVHVMLSGHRLLTPRTNEYLRQHPRLWN